MPERDRLYRAEAIVLRRMDLGEADRILTLFTKEYGKVRAIANGVRKPSSRKSGHVELFMRSKLLLARGHDLDIITQAEGLEAYRPLREDLRRITYAYYVAELLDHFTAEAEENLRLFRLLDSALGWIGIEDDLDLVVRYYELHLLSLVGFQPQLYHCVRCHAEVKPERNYFSAAEGGVICPTCGQAQSTLRPLHLAPFKVLRFLQTRDYETVRQVRISSDTHREMEALMQRYILYHLERQLKSTAFLSLIRSADRP